MARLMFAFFARAHLAHLQSEVTFWREAWRVERQRANLAVDRLLQERGIAGVTAPLMPDVPPAPSDEDRAHEQEFANVGDVGPWR